MGMVSLVSLKLDVFLCTFEDFICYSAVFHIDEYDKYSSFIISSLG